MAKLLSFSSENVGTVEVSVYTVPANTTSVIKEITITNKLGTPVAGTVDFQKGSVRTRIINANPMFLPYETKDYERSTFLNAGDIIKVVSNTASSLDIIVSVVETVVV